MSGNTRTSEESRCSAVAELLSPYLDGEVTSAEKTLVEEHVASCAGCAHDLDSLRLTVDLLLKLPTVEVPRAFTLQPSSRRPAPLFYFLRNATTAIAAVLIVLFSGSLYLRSVVPQPMPVASLAYDRPAPSVAAAPPAAGNVGVEESEALAQSRLGEEQKPAAAVAPAAAPENAARVGKPVESAAGAAKPAPPAEAPRAMASAPAPAPAGTPQPASSGPCDACGGESDPTSASAEGAPAAPALAAPAAPVSPQLDTPKKSATVEATAPADKAAASEAAPENETKAEPGRIPREAVSALSAAPVAPGEPMAWPMLEVQVALAVLLALCGGATLLVWRRSVRS